MTAVTTTLVDCDGCGITARIPSGDPDFVTGWLAGADWDERDGRDRCPLCVQNVAAPLFLFSELHTEAAAAVEGRR